MKRLGLMAFVMFLVGIVHAGPSTLTYQGYVLDGGGSPVADGTYRMRFRIFDAATVGTQRWGEIDTAVQVSSGLLSTTLGDGTVFGTLFSTYSSLWLEVAIDLNNNTIFDAGEVYSPRQKMAGAAWAMEADRLQGHDTAYFQRRVTGTAPAGQYIRQINADGTVVTGTDQGGTGDITAVIAGTGLSGGATANTATLSANTTYLQRRVIGVAPIGQYLRQINVDGTVVVAPDQIGTGDITAVIAGTGLSGGATANTATLTANTTYLQRRVTGVAPVGQFIRQINVDGTVVTAADQVGGVGDITGVAAGPGLFGGGPAGDVALGVTTAGITRAMIADRAVDEAKVQLALTGSGSETTWTTIRRHWIEAPTSYTHAQVLFIMAGELQGGTGSVRALLNGTEVTSFTIPAAGIRPWVYISPPFPIAYSTTVDVEYFADNPAFPLIWREISLLFRDVTIPDHTHWGANWTGDGVGLRLFSNNDHGLRGQTGSLRKGGVYGYSSGNESYGVYGRADGSAESYGVAAHHYWNGVGLGVWSFGGDLIHAYDGDTPSTSGIRFKLDNSGNLATSGTVRADNYLYLPARTCYANYDNTEMVNWYDDDDDIVYRGTYAYISSGVAAYASNIGCGVRLPQGATITELRAWVYDNDAGGIVWVYLERHTNGGGTATMASVSAADSGSVQNLATTTITTPVVDNANYSYRIMVYLGPSAVGTNIRFYNVRLTYTLPQVSF